MDIFFSDPSEVPLPTDEIRIRKLRVEPYPDGRRVRVYIEVDPFQKRPSAELSITNQEGVEIASASIVESMTRKMEIVMHLRENQPQGSYIIHALLFFATLEESPLPGSDYHPINQKLLDTAHIPFLIDPQ